ncbi:DarT ssDNA thymidine ADP-ribosyltransferase family protein [Bacteroides heparinolyticus]|uniref:DarT ssDNA thymidine ADP-ribosyltransferase family protein n=1 Tax=Prevotella heparinolytica TaxID=28113 RepID=UPI0035A10399
MSCKDYPTRWKFRRLCTFLLRRTFSDVAQHKDRFRRKQAEFLVKDFVPIECIHALYVRNQKKKEDVETAV